MNFNATLIGQSITFLVFVWFCMKFIWPPIMNALAERKAKIADGLAAADRGKHEQELGKKKAAETIHEAKQQAAEKSRSVNSLNMPLTLAGMMAATIGVEVAQNQPSDIAIVFKSAPKE